MTTSQAGCPRCRELRHGHQVVIEEALEQIGDELKDRAFARVTSYQSDLLYRCGSCGTAWLQQYWEVDTPETAFEEFGERFWQWTALTRRDVAEIEEAVKARSPLPHDRFYA